MKLIDIFQKLDESSVNEVHSHDDDYEDCDVCSGTGEGRWEGETCHACHGSGVQEPEHDDDDFDIPDDDDFDGGDEESYYEKSLRSRGLEEELAMKHQRDHKTQQFPDTSNSLAKRSYAQAEVPNVTKSADGHPTVKYRADSTHKAAQTRVEPTITPTTVKRKDSDRPIPSFLQKGVAEGLNDTQKKIEDTINKLEDRLKHAKSDEQWDRISARIERLQAGLKRSKQGVAEGSYDFDDYYSAEKGGEYGKDLTYAHGGSYGPGAGRDDIFKGQASSLPADPFSRTSGAVPKADGSGRVHTIAQPDEVDEGKKKEKEADYGDDYQDMVSRVKKLAGLGPLKTVYDPAKRVYKNVPVAVQPKK